MISIPMQQNHLGFFRNASYLCDVTLVGDDFKQITAHKLVLVASSEFFRNIIQETKQSQPILYIDGIHSSDLQNVLEYVYQGEVRISQEDLNRFLRVAQKLKLEGLMSDENEDTNFDEESKNVHSELGETPLFHLLVDARHFWCTQMRFHVEWKNVIILKNERLEMIQDDQNNISDNFNEVFYLNF